MKMLRNILFLGIIILIVYIILHSLNIIQLEKLASSKEGFTSTSTVWSDVPDFFGNILYNNNKPDTEVIVLDHTTLSRTIRLPGENKITGFKLDLYKGTTLDNGDTEMMYSLTVGNDINSMVKVINEYGFDKFKFGEDIKDLSLFENSDGTSKYNGKLVTIKLENTEGNIDKSVKYNVKAMIFGLDVFAMNSKTYGNFVVDDILVSDNKKITFMTDDSVATDKKVVAINLNISDDKSGNPADKSGNIKVSYDNSYDGNKRRYVAVGPIKQGFDVSSNNANIIYFNKPIIAQNIYLDTDTDIIGNTVTVYMSNPSKRDEINFKFEKQTQDNKGLDIAIQGEQCPSINQIMRRQLQTQQICEALEYKDRIRNAKLIYEKEKTYLKKLASQEKDLKDLEAIIKGLIDKKNKRISKNRYHGVEALDRELKQIEEVRKQAENELTTAQTAHDLKVSLNLEPKFNDILAKYNLN
jgi:hypothetical protein